MKIGFIGNMEDFVKINDVYAEFFSATIRPALV
jgi:hypothetical protein